MRRNGADLADGADVNGATGSTLALAAPCAYNASQITVLVSNAAGSAVGSSALLTVTPIAPAITAQPANATVSVGAPVSFAVGISGGTAPVSYQWKRNGIAIAGATAANYSLAATAIGDGGASFAVDVVNPAGTLSSGAAMLSVAAVGKSWGRLFCSAAAIRCTRQPARRSPSTPPATQSASGHPWDVPSPAL